jgi:predicted ferric reductase
MSAGRMAVLSLGVGASLAGGLALRTADLGQAPWLVSRASGMVAFALLSASVVFGLLLSTRLARRLGSPRVVFEVHNFLSVLTLAFMGLHGGALLFDGFFAFTPLSLLVPFAGPYAPFWVGLGVIGAWLTALVAASSWMRGRFAYASWRRLHYLSFGAYVLALVHGMIAGSDTGLPGVAAMYIVSGSLVAGLVAARVLGRRAPAPRRQPGAAALRSRPERTPAAPGARRSPAA